MSQQFECPVCEKPFSKQHSLDQHMSSTGHDFNQECTLLDDCYCDDCSDEDWDDDTPSVDLAIFKPKKQPSKKTLSISGKCLTDPEGCTISEIKTIAGSNLSIGRTCSYGLCGNSAKIACEHDCCAEHCPGCSVH